jgi:hypothetical protein
MLGRPHYLRTYAWKLSLNESVACFYGLWGKYCDASSSDVRFIEVLNNELIVAVLLPIIIVNRMFQTRCEAICTSRRLRTILWNGMARMIHAWPSTFWKDRSMVSMFHIPKIVLHGSAWWRQCTNVSVKSIGGQAVVRAGKPGAEIGASSVET